MWRGHWRGRCGGLGASTPWQGDECRGFRTAGSRLVRPVSTAACAPPISISWCSSCATSSARAAVTVEWRCGGVLVLPLSKLVLSRDALPPVEPELREDQLLTCCIHSNSGQCFGGFFGFEMAASEMAGLSSFTVCQQAAAPAQPNSHGCQKQESIFIRFTSKNDCTHPGKHL